MHRVHRTERVDEEHGADDNRRHAHRLSDFKIRAQNRVFIISVHFVIIFDVIDKVDRIVDGDTEYHRHNRHRHHIEPEAEIAHNSRKDDDRRDVRDHSDKPRSNAHKHEDEHSRDHNERSGKGFQFSAYDFSVHLRKFGYRSDGGNFSAGEKFFGGFFRIRDVRCDLTAVVCCEIDVDVDHIVIGVEPIVEPGAAGNLVQKEFLRQKVFIVGDRIICRVVSVQHAVCFFYDIEHRFDAGLAVRFSRQT